MRTNNIKPRVLLLCDDNKHGAATILDHIYAICNAKTLDVVKLNVRGYNPKHLNLHSFDVIIIHYSLVMCSDWYLSRALKDRIRDYQGLKACFIQDEYRFINDTTSAMRHMGINLLFTCIQPSEQTKVYKPEALPGLRCVHVLTGYVPKNLIEISHIPKHVDRPLDVCYRSRPLPYWLGALGQEKTIIANRFHADGLQYGLKMDLSAKESDRLYGKRWTKFLSSSKASLGTESGASIFDFTGDLQEKVDAYVQDHPSASFEEVSEKFFQDLDGKIYQNQISPRAFEAAALKTLMINYEGEYSGILKPYRHYVPLKKDHSNMSEVVKILKDNEALEEITENTYNEIALSPKLTYTEFTRIVETEITRELEKMQPTAQSGNCQPAANDSLLNDQMSATNKRKDLMLTEFYCRYYGIKQWGYSSLHHYTYRTLCFLVLDRVSKTTRKRITTLIRRVLGLNH
jgi:hypothetical protein